MEPFGNQRRTFLSHSVSRLHHPPPSSNREGKTFSSQKDLFLFSSILGGKKSSSFFDSIALVFFFPPSPYSGFLPNKYLWSEADLPSCVPALSPSFGLGGLANVDHYGSLWGEACLVPLAGFHGVNTPIMAHFKLTTSCL